FSTNPVGPVAPFSQQDFEVYVTIPLAAPDGTQDVVTVTASSGGSLLSAQSVLTTTASSAPVYNLNLTPTTVTQSGDNNATVVYTFTVQNTGNQSDSYTLSLNNDDWPTSLSTSSVGPVAPSASATFQISVTVPSGAFGKTFDQANVTAQSQGDASVSATSAFTTEVTTSYAMRLTPASDSRIGNPGKTVTYTLSLYNDSNITDTYNLANTASAWPVAFSINPVGPVAPFGQQDFEVYVTIPAGTLDGEQDIVTVTASSGGSLLSAQSVLTTIATTQTITRGVEIAPPVSSGNGAPGSVVNYTLTVTNTGSITDSITLSASGNSWSTTLHPTLVSLPSLGQATVSISVTIPSAATAGMSDTVTIQATATGVSDSSLLTTISNYRLYLPLVFKNYP
ncbi:MAG: hypothetical protein K8R89_04585, partial [Anaerolineae bacterium]|nr:hypothetical protein [Anaerolineae bacterium]